jgi:magnesium transporter
MRETHKEEIIWHDISSPQEKDIQFVKETFNPHPVILEELKTPSSRQKVEVYGDFLYLVLHFPVYDRIKKTSLPVEVDILAKEKEVITAHYEDVEPLKDLIEKCKVSPGFKSLCLGETSAEFIYKLIENIFEFGQRQIRHISEKVTAISEGIFSGREKDMIKEISVAKRDILDFRRILRHMQWTLESLEKKSEGFFGVEKKVFFDDLLGDYSRLWNIAENYKDTIESLEITNQTLLSSKIDEVMRLISILAFLLAPFTVVGTLFQINTQFTPLIGSPYDWWIAFILMVAGSVMLYIYFKRRGWL